MATCEHLIEFLNTLTQTPRTQKNREAINKCKRLIKDQEFTNSNELSFLLGNNIKLITEGQRLRVLNVLAVYSGLDPSCKQKCSKCNNIVFNAKFCKHCGNNLSDKKKRFSFFSK